MQNSMIGAVVICPAQVERYSEGQKASEKGKGKSREMKKIRDKVQTPSRRWLKFLGESELEKGRQKKMK
jgi:hypothetical protein